MNAPKNYADVTLASFVSCCDEIFKNDQELEDYCNREGDGPDPNGEGGLIINKESVRLNTLLLFCYVVLRISSSQDDRKRELPRCTRR